MLGFELELQGGIRGVPPVLPGFGVGFSVVEGGGLEFLEQPMPLGWDRRHRGQAAVVNDSRLHPFSRHANFCCCFFQVSCGAPDLES